MTWSPPGATTHVVLIGKGITSTPAASASSRATV